MKFRKCGELLHGRFSLRIKGMVYRNCVSKRYIYGSDIYNIQLRK